LAHFNRCASGIIYSVAVSSAVAESEAESSSLSPQAISMAAESMITFRMLSPF